MLPCRRSGCARRLLLLASLAAVASILHRFTMLAFLRGLAMLPLLRGFATIALLRRFTSFTLLRSLAMLLALRSGMTLLRRLVCLRTTMLRALRCMMRSPAFGRADVMARTRLHVGARLRPMDAHVRPHVAARVDGRAWRGHMGRGTGVAATASTAAVAR
jgi:hypothetical protein